MKDPADVREATLKFAVEYFSKNREAPSIQTLNKSLKIFNSDFYRAFPRGKEEMCELAGIPLQQDRMAQTANALSTRAAMASTQPMDPTWGTEVHDKEQLIPPITLTAKQ
jgi:hypothetical protein